MKKNYKAEELLHKYRQGDCTEEEKSLVESWHNRELSGKTQMPSEEELTEAGKHIWKSLPVHSAKRQFRFRLLAAASVALLLSAALYFITGKEQPLSGKWQTALKQPYQTDISPGSDKAVLILADGSEITLDKEKDGFLASQGNSAVNIAAGGQLIYHLQKPPADAVPKKPVYNQISTPRGGQYQVTLSDGTRVWLNAASSLRFPTAFAATERRVELTGEAYFEVAENKNSPFRVMVSGQVVEVLGTHFNINAYEDESFVKTTLLEGAVKVSGVAGDAVIHPGQQTVFNRSAGSLQVQNAHMEEAIAWKMGYFQFHDEKIESIMRKIARWYNVDIEYQGNYTRQGFVGAISKFENVSQVLRMLELTGTVQFKIEDRPTASVGPGQAERRIIVMP